MRLSRLVALDVLGLLVLLAVAVLRQLTGATAQDPGVEALSAALGAVRR